MSYTEHHKGRIDIPVIVEVDHPLVSKDGGSTGSLRIQVGDTSRHYSIGLSGGSSTATFEDSEHIAIDVHVDTDEYDRQAERCGQNVNLLTGSVVATEAAQVANIDDNSKKIASTIITGFFDNVKSSLSTISLEQRQILESRLALLRAQTEELLKKQKQMEHDYQRTSARYVKVFQDLNKELETRVKRLDAPVYKAASVMEQETDRMLQGDYAYVTSTVNSENANLTAQIGAALMKTEAQRMTGQATRFLAIYEESKQTIASAVISADFDGEDFFLPAIFVQTHGDGDIVESNVFCDESRVQASQVNEIVATDTSGSLEWADQKSESIKPYFTEELERDFGDKVDEHSQRVREMIVKLLNK